MPGVMIMHVRTHVGEQVDPHAEDLAVVGDGELDLLQLVAAVVGDLRVLAARLDPLHRPAELERDDLHREDLLAVELQLGAEAAADVGRDDPDLVLRDAGRQRQQHPHDVRDLGGRPQGELAVRHRSGAATTARGSIAIGISRWLT